MNEEISKFKKTIDPGQRDIENDIFTEKIVTKNLIDKFKVYKRANYNPETRKLYEKIINKKKKFYDSHSSGIDKLDLIKNQIDRNSMKSVSLVSKNGYWKVIKKHDSKNTNYGRIKKRDSKETNYDRIKKHDSKNTNYGRIKKRDSKDTNYGRIKKHDSRENNYDGIKKSDSKENKFDKIKKHDSKDTNYGRIKNNNARHIQNDMDITILETDDNSAGLNETNDEEIINETNDNYYSLKPIPYEVKVLFNPDEHEIELLDTNELQKDKMVNNLEEVVDFNKDKKSDNHKKDVDIKNKVLKKKINIKDKNDHFVNDKEFVKPKKHKPYLNKRVKRFIDEYSSFDKFGIQETPIEVLKDSKIKAKLPIEKNYINKKSEFKFSNDESGTEEILENDKIELTIQNDTPYETLDNKSDKKQTEDKINSKEQDLTLDLNLNNNKQLAETQISSELIYKTRDISPINKFSILNNKLRHLYDFTENSEEKDQQESSEIYSFEDELHEKENKKINDDEKVNSFENYILNNHEDELKSNYEFKNKSPIKIDSSLFNDKNLSTGHLSESEDKKEFLKVDSHHDDIYNDEIFDVEIDEIVADSDLIFSNSDDVSVIKIEEVKLIEPEEVKLIEPEEVKLIEPEEVKLIEPEKVRVSNPEKVRVSNPEEVIVSNPE
ncbi:hypothetical protein DMUE_1359 [Dictyocoela muelleri]|nr:hypothetical protein DMUE_1359 [Dictyocoela muelleri]